MDREVGPMTKKARTEKTPQQIIEDVFSRAVSYAKSQDARRGARILDLTGPVLKRRKTAVLNFLPQIRERYGTRFYNKSAETLWAEACTSTVHTINGINVNYHIFLAAAVYILDILEQRCVLSKARPFLEMDPEKITCDGLYDIHFSLYDERMIQELVHILRMRDGQSRPIEGYINEISAKRTTPSCFEMPDTRKDVRQWTERERFQAIMSMIPPVYIQRAVDRFEKNMWEFLDAFYARAGEYASEIEKMEKELDRVSARCQELSQKMLFRQEPGFPFAVDSRTDRSQDLADMKNLSARMRKLESGTELTSERFRQFVELAHAIPIEIREEIDFLPPEDIACIKALGVEDPYETCFGFLCLMESGSDLPWIYNAPAAVLLMAARKLPWTAFMGDSEYDEDWDGEWDEVQEEDQEEDRDEEAAEPEPPELSEHIPREPLDWIEKKKDFYTLKYTDYPLYAPRSSPTEDWKLNLPQVVFGLTNTVMPRNLHWYDETAEDLTAAGMSEDFAECLELYLQIASEIGQADLNQTLFSRSETEDSPEKPPEPEAPEKEETEEKETEEKGDALLKEAEQEISRLKQALYEAESKAHSLEKEMGRMKEQSAEERQELAELRELLYLQSNAQTDQPESEKEPELPYRTHTRIAVYGGHETWWKAIRPMLPDVTFIPRGQKPNPELIRNQDQIWIQANAMAHKDFYRLINAIRLYHIPVRYFSFASARKCAIQLAEADLKDTAGA